MDKKLLSITIIILVIGLGVGYVLGYSVNTSQIQTLETRINELEVENNNLGSSYNALNNTYTDLLSNYAWLKQHSFTYYEVNDALNISSLKIEKHSYYEWTIISGNITNIGDKPIEEAYVYVILRNPDGTMRFDSYLYEKIEDLYIGETAYFDMTVYSYQEGQTAEIWLVF